MKFSEIPGNEVIKTKLIHTVLDQRVSHAQLFFGPEESDKLALAIAYAQFINCTGRLAPPAEESLFGEADPVPETAVLPSDSCGTCPSCVKYQKLAHPDLHFVYPVSTTQKVSRKPLSKYFIDDWRAYLLENNYACTLQGWYDAIGIENKQGIINAEDCTEIITTLSYKSYESDYKVMIIWMAERIFYAAAPKILKILEEPPEKTLFILITESPDQIINTILSRTLLVKIPASPNNSGALSGEDALYFPLFRQWMRDCYAAKVPPLISFTNDISRSGREKQKSFLAYALRTLGLCSTRNLTGTTPPGITGEELEFISKFSAFTHPGNLVQLLALLNEAFTHIERNAHAGILFMDLSLKISRQLKPGALP
ncbi:MAG TPA: hypothetical protein PKG48_01350 [Bacteroidales bacterium]|nr:hypothetical protein [Bacteroidales bacterium]HPS63173.1 hypothetical protein [Bacteroidales bacterium]